ncbi:MAG: hypothetical protein QOE45_107 [Frankiaceae bacterium]|jgi:heme A synthase|nr:hypothetical protein [Frankiaceae bacterium]
MSPRHPVRAASVLATTVATTLLLAFCGTAFAQPDIPPGHKDLKNGRPWTFKFNDMIVAGAVLLLVAIVVGYLVKSRDFRANAKRGGSK